MAKAVPFFWWRISERAVMARFVVSDQLSNQTSTEYSQPTNGRKLAVVSALLAARVDLSTPRTKLVLHPAPLELLQDVRSRKTGLVLLVLSSSGCDPERSLPIGARRNELLPKRPDIIVISDVHCFRERAAVQTRAHHAVKGRPV
jgi:hypothetical protein